MTFGIIGNAIFILISGYFMADRGGSGIRIGEISRKLLLQLGFAVILLVCIPPVIHRIKPDIFITLQSITIFNSMSWFVGYYFVIVLCGILFLNRFLMNLDYKKYLAFLLAVFAFISLSYSGGLADSLISGLRTVITGIFLYSLGGFIKEFRPFRKVRMYIFFLVIGLVYALVCLSGYNVTEQSIETYERNGTTDPFIQSIPGFENYSIVIIIIAVCMFEIFQRIKLPQSRVVTFFGRSTFMIYLIHDNGFFYEIWNLRDWVTTLSKSPLIFLGNLFKWAAYTFAVGVIAYALYILVMDLLKRSRRLAIKE